MSISDGDCYIDGLFVDDLNLIKQNKELEETHILFFNYILKKNTHYRPQAVSLFEDPECIIPASPDEDYIQILYSDFHFVCCYYNMKNIFIYDSLNRGYLSENQRIYLEHLFPFIDLRFVKFPKVQKQKNGIDCGIHAIAMAISLVYRLKPEKVHYDTNLMRSHLIEMFQSIELVHFPQDSNYEQQNVISLGLAAHKRYISIDYKKK